VTGVRLSRVFWLGAAAILIVAALIAVAAIVRGEFGETEAQILGTLLVLLVAGATAISALALIERGAAQALAVVAMAGAAICFAVITASIWDGFSSETLVKWAASAAPILISLLLLATQRLLLRVARLAPVFYGTAAAATVAAVLTIAVIWAEQDGSQDGFAQAIAVFWILTALGYLLLPVLQRFTSAGVPETADRVLAELNGVKLVATKSGEGIEARLAPGERLALRRG